ncbi:MAG TPA: gfo/Idh/MocA family oxidoreductase [Lentisphaeria bacterium]|nr:MAG: oxidoreductase [Lentisphaerae bacterium GWF2_49_21]HBC89514.1 gfo/Idh/MocA family oxidoreductase [Lentisphaeria bacterium]
MRKLRVGIIGQGRSGRDIHANTVIKLVNDKFEIAAVCDLILERCEPSQKDTGCAVYADYRKMFKDKSIDLIINATTSEQHVPVTMKILDAGFNVLTEKPLARKTSDVDKLIKKAVEAGKVFAIYQQSRFAPYFTKTREIIDSGVLGRIVMVKIAFNGFARRWDWQTLQCMDAGNLRNTGPHPLDQALQIFGDTDPDVFCIMDKANSFGDAEDHVKLILHGKGHPTIDLEISSCCAYPPYTYQVYGTNGGITGDMKHLDWKYFKPEEAPEQELITGPMPNLAYCKEELKWYTEKWDASAEEANLFDNMATRFYNRLYDTIVNGAPLAVTQQEVRRQIAVIEECHRQNPMPVLKRT